MCTREWPVEVNRKLKIYHTNNIYSRLRLQRRSFLTKYKYEYNTERNYLDERESLELGMTDFLGI
jgi:hypothetical protein